MSGSLVKLKIIAYSDPEYKEEAGETYEVLFNPEEFTENFGVTYSESQPSGTSATELKFDKIKPQTFDLNFIFDGTGVAVNDRGIGAGLLPETPLSVEEQIRQFKAVALEYKGEIHEPRYLKIIWGTLLFKGRLTDLKITYTLFKPDGTPLRAKATAVFKESIDHVLLASKEAKSSPDLTHVRIVKAGDNLPLMTYKIYKDPSYYMEIARVNRLKNFRRLTPGAKIFFPPINREAI